MRRILAFFGLATVLAAAGACSSKDTVYFHSIGFGPSARSSDSPELPVNLGIEPFTAAPELGTLNMISRRGDLSPRFQTYDLTQLWAALPATLATSSALEFFTPRCSNVESYPGSWVPDRVLRAELDHFEEVRDDSGKPAAWVVLRYEVFYRRVPPVRERDIEYLPLFTGWRTAEGRVPFDGAGSLRDGSALALALGQAMDKALGEILARMKEPLPAKPLPGEESFRGP
ncbi:MAG: hypothetical protein HY720_05935 [Planctomycetes bacterium]|nr:hypothetical protein [Planctomycetota bacterium]